MNPASTSAHGLPLLRPRRLQPGDTLALVNPSNAVYERAPYERAAEIVRALGFNLREAPNLRARHGQFGGTDAQRAADITAMFADPGVHGILALTGGSGGTRMMAGVDYEVVRAHPKFFGGYSDLTALLNAIHARTGLVTFHSPLVVSDWNAFTLDSLRALVIDGQAATLANATDVVDALGLCHERARTLRGGRAQGPLLGGNLAVLAAMMGSKFLPSFDGAILFLEDTNEYIYRVDRMLSTLRNAGVFERLAGVVLGAFTNCGPSEDKHGTLTLDEVWDEYFLPLGVPVFAGAMFGHIKRKYTLPVGLPAEIDADAGTVRLLQPAVLA